jgi:hypothetical protein
MPFGDTSVLSTGWFIFPGVQPLFGKHQQLQGEGRDGRLDNPKSSLTNSYGVTLISGGVVLVPLSVAVWQRDAAPFGFRGQSGRLW